MCGGGVILDYSEIVSYDGCCLMGFSLFHHQFFAPPYKAQLDREWVKERLSAVFGGDVRDIANKYVVDIEGILVTNHDGNYYLTEKK